MEKAKPRSRRWWRQMVAKYDAVRGQVGLWEFASENGVNRSTLAWWASHLRHEKQRKGEAQPGALLPVVVAGTKPGAEECGPGLRVDRWLEAELPDGVKLRFCEGTSELYVVGLVQGLRRLPC